MDGMHRPALPSTAYLDHLVAETAGRREALAGEPEHRPDGGATAGLAAAAERAADRLEPDLAEVVRRLHADPEPAFEEHRSAATLIEVLARHGVTAELGAHGVATAFRAEAGTATGPTIAICAEYDALPGIGHACGHNVIAAAGVGAFLAAREALTASDAPTGRVVLLGTPAEEGHTGKEVLARQGALEGIDAAIMVHPYGLDVADQVWLGRRLLTWTFTGRPAHASAQPYMGRNALDAATLAYQGIGLLRQQMPPVDRVHATIAEGGTRPSIITERAVVHLYARSKYPDTLRDLSRRLDDVARGAALMTGTDVEITWDDGAHPSLPVRTNRALTERWVAAQRRRGRDPLPAGVLSETLAASTDFGNFSFRVPGIHPLVQVSSPDVALHTAEFAAAAATPAAVSAAVDGAAGLAATALDYLADARLRAAVHEEFAHAGGPVDVEHHFD
ncbi:M20 family metallopeptidase [Promicromonospora citrea]|uniref:Peptidase M20 domain-containing protein 2 n=1 Tax=Promicromonospora citrea TaxID=43677 RepID=A0A8H9L6A0_9MICO|nr:M20 family metallopeptidase [Promicromonospora citrea]NNH50810.1 M20 family metallopeptidase [Promicromonospora citrea]GGM35805.1 amidohydrolase [Promicromonospora citrea]